MKLLSKLCSLTALLLAAALLLSSCAGGINTDEADGLIEDLLSKISSGDYDGAEELLHPEKPLDLEKYFERKRAEHSLDYSRGFEIQRYTHKSYSRRNSKVGGSAYSVTFTAAVGYSLVEITVEIVKNKAGYGIYNLSLEVES